MRRLPLCIILIFFSLSGCKETVVENQIPKEFTNDLLHADLIGKVTQKNSGAMVIVSQVNPVDSVLISPTDGSFAFHELRAGNYDVTIRANNLRIYFRYNLSLPGGGVTYMGEIDLSTTPDLVDEFYPTDNSEIVYDWRYGRISISITFTHPMDRASVEKAFATNPPSEGVFYWGQYSQAPRSVLYASSYNDGFDLGATITTFSKISSFTYSMSQKDSHVDTNYTVTIATSAHDTMGNHLRFPLAYTFRTVQSYTTIYGIQTSPVHGDINVDPLNNSSGIMVTFPRRMDPVSTEAATTITPSMNRIFLWPDENNLRIYTGGPFLSDTTITVRIDSTAMDKDGVRLGQVFTFSFRTAPFQVSGTSPTNAQLFVTLTQQISINFNSYVILSSAQSAISISPSIAGTFSYGGYSPYETLNQIVFTPTGSFTPNIKYTVTVGTGIKDMYGVSLKTTYTFSFVTRPN